MSMNEEKAARIRELNDNFRRLGLGGTIVMTRGVSFLSEEIQKEIIVSVKKYDDFTEDNDPYGEHDFGAFEVEAEKLFWKIDYYAPDMRHGSSDASNPKITKRVMTIMLRDEY